jgi:hypothetical protein
VSRALFTNFLLRNSEGKMRTSDKTAIACVGRAVLVVLLAVLSCHIVHASTPPVISGLLVNGVAATKASIGDTLTIQGSGFGGFIGFSTASLEGFALAGAGVKPISWSDTSIVVAVPQGVISGPVLVTVGGQASNSVQLAIRVVITGLSSTSGLAGSYITINGEGFGTQGGKVTFNGVRAMTAGWDDRSIFAKVPTTATAGAIRVTVSGQVSNGVPFTPTPSIADLSPDFGVAGTEVTITGNSFGKPRFSSKVTFNGVLSMIKSWTNNQITVVTPSAATTGDVVVTVNGVSSAGVLFTYP